MSCNKQCILVAFNYRPAYTIMSDSDREAFSSACMMRRRQRTVFLHGRQYFGRTAHARVTAYVQPRACGRRIQVWQKCLRAMVRPCQMSREVGFTLCLVAQRNSMNGSMRSVVWVIGQVLSSTAVYHIFTVCVDYCLHDGRYLSHWNVS